RPPRSGWGRRRRIGRKSTAWARYLLAQNRDVESSEQEETPVVEGEGYEALSGEPSQNIEDRRDEPIYGPGVMRQIWGELPHDVAPQAQVFTSNPLSNALGFRDVGRSPSQAPQFYGPNAPPSFLQFLQNQRGY